PALPDRYRPLLDDAVFATQRDQPDAGLMISRPFAGGAKGEWLIGLSRRWTRPDGSFGGTAVVTLKLDFFRGIFAGMALGPGGRITLFREDGIALMRGPYDPAAIGRDFGRGTAYSAIPTATEGSYRSISSQDGIERFYVFHRLEGMPLVMNLGLGVKDIEAAWRLRALAIGGSTLALIAALVGVMLRLRRELVRRQAAEAAARDSEAGFRLLAENTSDVVSRISTKGIRLYVSPSARRIHGRSPEQMVGQPAMVDIHAEDLPQVRSAVARLRSRDADGVTVTYRSSRADGTEIWLESTLQTVIQPITGRPDGLVAVSRDITARKAMENQLTALARLDGLTGVANRRAFDEAVSREWSRCLQAETPIALIMVDVDRFKAYNDHYGHPGGDSCLRVVAATVGATIRRAADLVARYGGEEFVVLLPETDAAGANAVAQRLRGELEALQLPHAGAASGVVTVSVGVAAMVPIPGRGAPGPERLIEMADRALYYAKQTGRNRVVCAPVTSPTAPSPAA
ncbi:MAG: diguanylate cyclase, partial [Belnapia sp.]|nr:diguanylate cyclase [Belnapia sp.]